MITSDQGDDDEPEVEIENSYYNAKAMRESSIDEAVEMFREVVRLEKENGEKGEWGFKALKQIVKNRFKQGNYEDMMKAYRELLTYIKSAVTRNVSEKSINSILEYVSTAQDADLLQKFYAATLESLLDAKNDRLWFKTQIKLGNLHLQKKEYHLLAALLKSLYKHSMNETDEKKGTQLLELYALEIQMHTENRNTKKLRELYQKSLQVKSAIPHPRIMGIIRECGGKMHMAAKAWEEASTDFFEAFKNYDDCGSLTRIQCLKYLVLAYMLKNSDVDPFDAQELKSYRNHPEIEVFFLVFFFFFLLPFSYSVSFFNNHF